ncbi:MAG: tetratricopeptide repeat protein [Lachnospiraceae bacterium]|nr:tetratricopeptide repeat protein [Lachnospiraceae bacterium]
MKLYKRIVKLSNSFYNEALRKAKVRDLSGAAESLKQSLKCNKNNVEARNLLGLVYFEMGETVQALSEWIISKNIRSKKNIADDFMAELQDNTGKLSTIDQTIKKYNQALSYANQDSVDLAIIQLKKIVSMNPKLLAAYQLLALCYIKTEQWDRAKRIILKATKIDTNNTTLKYYLREVETAMSERADGGGDSRNFHHEDAFTYQSGNETIIQPINERERGSSFTVLNIIIGLIVGAAIMWFLVLPARIQTAKSDTQTQLQETSDELTSRNADIGELKKRVEALQEDNEKLKEQLSGFTSDSGLMNNYNYLMEAAQEFMEHPEDAKRAAEILSNIDPNSVSADSIGVSEAFANLYEYMSGVVSEQAARATLDDGEKKYNEGNYSAAIELLEDAVLFAPNSDEALYYLAQSYIHDNNESQGRLLLNKLITNFPDSRYAQRASEYLSSGQTDDAAADTQEGGETTGAGAGAVE